MQFDAHCIECLVHRQFRLVQEKNDGEKAYRYMRDVMRLLLQSGKRNLSKSAIISYVWGLESNAVEKLVFVLPKACKRGRMYV